MENKLKGRLCLCVLAALAVYSCGDLKESDDLPIPEIRFSEVPGDLLADGTAVTTWEIDLNPAQKVAPGQRKLAIASTIGQLLINGELKKSGDLLLNENGKTSVSIKHPLSGGSGTLTTFIGDGLKTASKTLSFKSAYPDSVIIDVSKAFLSDTSSLDVSCFFLRSSGKVSFGLPISYELLDANDKIALKAVFNPSRTASDSSGKSKSKLMLGKIVPGIYQIRVGYKDDDGVTHYFPNKKPITI
ncbi:hypothetical protein L0663_04970 [Dyadobacter sp. CY107]|uniref:hypothetical protein n=1 Tax=Dyadobacter fanqingshengii TaxID=2906443 RepID=UPI001F292A9F|nr:hypothetical protein [Dyadobacter fanqingshengii]MCF2502718.1 hypothetical protein [Dyadobacter fanqingshengii]